MNTFKLFVMLFAILAMATYAAQACAAEPKNCLPKWGIHEIKPMRILERVQPFFTSFEF